MVKVVHVLEAFETGCARHLLDRVERAEVDHVVVVPPRRVGGHTDPRAVQRLRAAGAAVHLVEMRRSPSSSTNVTAVRAVGRLVSTSGADVVHGHSSIGGVVARLAAFATGRRAVYTPNGLAPGSLAQGVERLLGRITAVVVAVSPSEQAEVLRRRLVPPNRVAVIPNGIDPAVPPRPARSLRDIVGVPDGAPLVGSVGRLVDQKAPLDLVRSWAEVSVRVPRARFVLVGDGPLAGAVDALATSVGLDGRYTRLPVLADADAHLADLTVFTLASRFEGSPYVVLEAMRAGVPVVATRVTGTRDLLGGGAGILVPAGDAKVLADATVAALREPPATAVGRRLVQERYDVADLGRAYTRLYYGLVPGR